MKSSGSYLLYLEIDLIVVFLDETTINFERRKRRMLLLLMPLQFDQLCCLCDALSTDKTRVNKKRDEGNESNSPSVDSSSCVVSFFDYFSICCCSGKCSSLVFVSLFFFLVFSPFFFLYKQRASSTWKLLSTPSPPCCHSVGCGWLETDGFLPNQPTVQLPYTYTPLTFASMFSD